MKKERKTQWNWGDIGHFIIETLLGGMHSELLPPSMVLDSDADYETTFLHNLYRNSALTYEALGVPQNHLLGSRDEDHWQF